MTYKTKGIILRTVKYGETSLVVTAFTELFGVQTYMVNGVRSSKPATSKANYFQPTVILDMVVYHNEHKAMNRIKEFRFAHLYKHISGDVIKNCIALYMVELMHKCLKQPEPNPHLFHFCEEALLQLDNAGKMVTANFPLFFALHLTHFFGFRMNDNFTNTNSFLDLREGNYVDQQPVHPHFIKGEKAAITSQLLRVMQPPELDDLKLNQATRRALLLHYQDYYALHIHDFGQMKTLQVLQEVL